MSSLFFKILFIEKSPILSKKNSVKILAKLDVKDLVVKMAQIMLELMLMKANIQSEGFLTQCCVCKSLFISGLWIPGILGLHGRISHGYCPSCFAKEIQAADDFLDESNIQDEQNTILQKIQGYWTSRKK